MLIIANPRPLDALAIFETASSIPGSTTAPVRYSIRQVLDQEYQKYQLQKAAEARQSRYGAGNARRQSTSFVDVDQENPIIMPNHKTKVAPAKRDFFGRIINESRPSAQDNIETTKKAIAGEMRTSASGHVVNQVWVSFHEGFSNAVRKPITLDEFMRGI